MYPFNYHRPESLEAAAAALTAAEDGQVLAGGQTLIPTLKQRLASPSDVIDLASVPGLGGIRRQLRSVVSGGRGPGFHASSSFQCSWLVHGSDGTSHHGLAPGPPVAALAHRLRARRP